MRNVFIALVWSPSETHAVWHSSLRPSNILRVLNPRAYFHRSFRPSHASLRAEPIVRFVSTACDLRYRSSLRVLEHGTGA